MTKGYPNNTGPFVDALRELADRLAAVADMPPTIGLAVTVGVQLHQSYGTQDERVAAVDAIAAAIGIPSGDTTNTLYGTPCFTRIDDTPLGVDVFTGYEPDADGAQ